MGTRERDFSSPPLTPPSLSLSRIQRKWIFVPRLAEDLGPGAAGQGRSSREARVEGVCRVERKGGGGTGRAGNFAAASSSSLFLLLLCFVPFLGDDDGAAGGPRRGLAHPRRAPSVLRPQHGFRGRGRVDVKLVDARLLDDGAGGEEGAQGLEDAGRGVAVAEEAGLAVALARHKLLLLLLLLLLRCSGSSSSCCN